MNVVLNQTLEPKPAKPPWRSLVTRAGHDRLLSRESLDGRTAVAKAFDQLVGAIHADLGGRNQLSAIEASLVESFAAASVVLDNLTTRILTGAAIDNALVAMHASAISAQVRVAAKLGTARRAKPVQTLDEFLIERAKAEAAEREAIENEPRIMSAVATDMIDFVRAIERAVPWGLHPCTDVALQEYLSEMRGAVDDPAAGHELTGKICWRVVQELEFSAENYECVGDHCDAWHARRQAQRFAARFGQRCEPIIRMSK